ncbi:uncharacterized protein LOC144727515 [Lampetra planeri]
MEGGDGASAWISDRASAKDGATQQETEPQKHRETAPWPGRDQHRSDSPDITYAPADTTSFSVKDPTGEGSPTPLGTSSQRPPRHLHDSDSDHNDEYEDDDDDDDADSILDLVNPSQAVYRPHGSSPGDLGGLDDLGVEGIGAERSPDEAVKGVGATPRRDVRDGGYGDAKVDDGEDDQVDEEVDLYRAGPQGAGGKEEVRGWTADGGGVTEALRDASFVRAPPPPQGPPLIPGAPPLSQLPSAIDALLSDLTGPPSPSAPSGPPGLPDLFPCAPPHSSSSSAPLGYREVPIVLESGPSLPPAAIVVGGLREISVTFESSLALDYDDDDDDDDDDKVGDVLKLQRDQGAAFDTAATAATAATARDSEDDDDDEVEDDRTKGYAVQETAAPSSLASSYTVPYSSFRARDNNDDHEDDDDDDDDDDDGDNIHEGGARGASGLPLDGRASDLVEPMTMPSLLPPPSPSSSVPAPSSPPYVLIGPGRAQPAQQNKPWQPHEDPWSELTADFQTQPQQPQQQQQQPAPWDEDDDDEDEEEEDDDARAARGGTLPLEEEVYPAVFFSASGAASAAAPSHEGDLVASGVAGSGPGRACEPHTFLLSNGGSDTSTSSDESGSSEASIGSVVRARGRRGVDGEGGGGGGDGEGEGGDAESKARDEDAEKRREEEEEEVSPAAAEVQEAKCRDDDDDDGAAAASSSGESTDDSSKSEGLSPSIEVPERSEFEACPAGGGAPSSSNPQRPATPSDPVLESRWDVTAALEDALREEGGRQSSTEEQPGGLAAASTPPSSSSPSPDSSSERPAEADGGGRPWWATLAAVVCASSQGNG